MDWQPGMAVDAPVYIDANILVGVIVRAHRLYRSCVKLIGDLLTKQTHILVSPISIEESLWAIARLSYYELARQRTDAHFNMRIYERWCDRIFEAHGSRIAAISSMLQDWSTAGLPVEVVPKTQVLWNQVMDITPAYMRQFRLAPADAIHLALAQTHARTFITADSDFEKVTRAPSTGELVIFHVVA